MQIIREIFIKEDKRVEYKINKETDNNKEEILEDVTVMGYGQGRGSKRYKEDFVEEKEQ